MHAQAILVVEDNPADVTLVREALEEGGADLRIDAVSRASEALAKIQAHDYDAILLDLNLPDTRGIDTISTIVGSGAAAPIVVLTGSEDDEELGHECIRAGAEDFLCKSEVRRSSLDARSASRSRAAVSAARTPSTRACRAPGRPRR